MSDWLIDSIPEHKSRPPLRWVANLAGSIASSGLLEVSYLEDEGKTDTFKYKFNCWKWDNFWPIYEKYGTQYRLRNQLSDYTWDYVDEETGDAFRLVNNEG